MENINGLPPVHPGEILREIVMPEAGITVTAAAKALGISRQMFHAILAERKPLSAAMCMKVAKMFGSSPETWMRLQASYDLKRAAQDKKLMKSIARITSVKASEEIRALR